MATPKFGPSSVGIVAAASAAAGKAAMAPIGLLAGVLVLLLWSYWPTLSDLAAFWQQNSDYSAGALVPLVAAYMVWSHRKALRDMPVQACWAGMAVLLAAQAVRFFGLLFMYGSLERLSLLLTVVAVVLLVLGRRITWHLAPVLAFLALMFPLPYRVHNTVAMPLQSFASGSAVVGLEMLGHLVTREGNVLRLGSQTTVAVAEACSGLRMLTAFVIVAAALAFVVRKPRWQKALVVASSVPVAILSNTLRLVATVLVFEYWGSEVGEKFFHDFAGIVMIPFAWAVLMAELWVLRWVAEGLGGRPAAKACRAKASHSTGLDVAKGHSQAAAFGQWLAVSRPAVISLLAVFLVAGLGYRVLAARIGEALGQTLPLRQPLSSLPLQIDDWQGQDIPLDENIRRIAGDDDSVNRQYVNQKTGRAVGVYIGYMGRPRSRMGHRPDVCYRAHGFSEQSRVPTAIVAASGQKVPALLYEFAAPQPGSPRDLVLATYIINRRYTNEVAAANDVNTRSVGLTGRMNAYVARIQVSIRATGDQVADVAALSSYISQVVGPLAAMMPGEAVPQAR